MLQEITSPSTVHSIGTDKLGTLTIQRVGGDHTVSGNQYDRTKDMTRAQIAKEIRQDLKQHWETDFGIYDPAEVKVSVRTHNYAGGGSINIFIQEVKDFDLRYKCRADFKLAEAIKQIGQRYQRQTSNSREDYCHNNFYLFVELDHPFMDQVWSLPLEPEDVKPVPVEPTPEDYVSAARGKYHSVPGLVVSDVEPDYDDTDGEYVMAYVWVTDKEAADFDFESDECDHLMVVDLLDPRQSAYCSKCDHVPCHE